MTYCGPDWSDSDDDSLGDDGDYNNFKAKTKYNISNVNPPEQTEEQKRQQELSIFFSKISSGNIEGVVEFLDKGFDANSNIRDGWTPLLLSASHGNPELTKVLIEFGADVHQHREGETVLMQACKCPDSTSPFEKSLKVIQLLVEKGAKVQTINRRRMDALMHAACIGNLPAVQFLLPKANKHAVDNQRWSALTWAISNNKTKVVEYLLTQGFDPNLRDVRGDTPLDIAKANDFESIVDLFPKKEADLVAEITSTSKLNFEDNFSGLKPGEKPRFFGEVCDILCAVKCGHLIPIFLEKNVSFDQLLSMSDDDLREIGILLPYQRHRILTGLYRYHKQPYHPKSLHVCVGNDTYSNIDVATQIMSAIQQIIAMEASLKFILKTLKDSEMTDEQRELSRRTVNNIKTKIKSSQMVVKKLQVKFKMWDKIATPVDLITKDSIRSKFPWRTVTFFVGILSLFAIKVVVSKLKK